MILPTYVAIILNHYKDPYQPTSISWKVRSFFFRGSSDFFFCPIVGGHKLTAVQKGSRFSLSQQGHHPNNRAIPKLYMFWRSKTILIYRVIHPLGWRVQTMIFYSRIARIQGNLSHQTQVVFHVSMHSFLRKMKPSEQWRKPWLFRVYGGLWYYPLMWRLY